MEKENAELRRRIDAVAGELKRSEVGDVVPSITDGMYGLGPAASKVYSASQGVSIGGYGEMLYQNFQSDSTSDELDFLRAVLYFGHKFDEHFLFNSEIEFEHGSTEDDGSVSVEFAYLDYLHVSELNYRAGLVLIPMGFLNELHEPTAFLSARRTQTERLILPTTWREGGAGVFGDIGGFAYRSYVVNGFDASGFTSEGLRDGRQNGSEAEAEDFAWVGRLDYTAQPGLLVGASAYFGNSGQMLENAGDQVDAATTIVEGHVEYKWRGLQLRVLATQADVDDVDDLNAALGLTGADSIGSELNGFYAELGYDVLSLADSASKQSLTPFVRWETLDTQAEVPSGFSSNPANDVDITTFGVCWKPIDRIVVKVDYQDFDNGSNTAEDQWNAAIGYIF